MKNSLPQFVLGYYGCDLSRTQKILDNNIHLRPSRNDYDWLGHGIYFWENDPHRALRWAEECKKNPKLTKGNITTPSVLGAIIDLGNCLNLTDSANLKIVKTAYNEFKKLYNKSQFQKSYRML